MTDSSQDGIDNTMLRVSPLKRAFRVETILFMMALPFIAVFSNKFWANEPNNLPVSNIGSNGLPQRELQDALTSLQEIQEAILSLRETQAALQGEIDATKGQINEKKLQEVKEQVVTPMTTSSSHHRNPLSAVKDFPIFEVYESKAKSVKNVDFTDYSPRKMQTAEAPVESATDTGCDGTLFRLELSLDQFPPETIVDLENEDTGELLANLTFADQDPFTDITFEQCLDKGAYIVRIKDTFADGLACFDSFDGLPCYNIFIDNELVIEGTPFQTAIRVHTFDSNSLCLINDVVIYTLNFDVAQERPQHKVHAGKFKTDVDFFDLPDQDPNVTSRSYYSCLNSSIYELNIRPRRSRGDLVCDDHCYTISVNGNIIVVGPNRIITDELYIKSFFITIDHIGGERKCKDNPIISPINDLSSFAFDDRIARVLNVIQALSKMQDIFTRGTSQYEATCYILYDDPLKIKAEDKLLAQRYALAVFLFSTNQRAEVQLPSDMCFNSKFQCDEEGDIISVDWSGEGMDGIIPTEIGHLLWLETLRLEKKNLQGTIPTEINRLENLHILSLDHNKLRGTIPTEVGDLPLTFFSLWDNQLTGTIPTELGNSKNLAILYLHENMLTGTIPKEIFLRNTLNQLVTNANELSGSIPTEIGINSNMQIFYTENNKHTGKIPSELGSAQLLWMIDLGHNALTGTIPTELANISMILDEVRFNDNFLTGPFPELQPKGVLYLNNNTLTGSIPPSIFNLSISGLKINDNDVTGEVTEAFCDNLSFVEGFDGVFDLWVDDSAWFIDRPLVICPCCDDVNCHMWEFQDIPIVGGTRRPSCPASNSFKREIYERFIIIDDVAQVTHGEGIGKGIAGTLDLCLSPTGCFSVKHEVEDGRDDGDITWDREYTVVFSNNSRTLEEKDTCDAVMICGESIGPEDPRRTGLNHLTHILLSDLSFLDRPNFPEYQALCWLMRNDTLYENYNVCDGTLLQRYVMALLYYTYKASIGFETLEPIDTCLWPGVTCDPRGRFVEELDLSGKGLKGHLVTELGLLTRLRKIDLSNNKLQGIFDEKIFEYLPNLETFNVSFNKFGGGIPHGLLILPKIERIDLSNNLLVGVMPTLAYSQSIKSFDVENNLLVGFIPNELIACMQLENINLSRNNFKGNIDPRLGLLRNLRELHLDQNILSGSIPVELFDLSLLEKLELQSNGLTGSIPSEIARLKNLTIIALNHNVLKGPMPPQISGLTKLQYLHLHVNILTGTAPFLPHLREFGEDNRYITDCGSPFHHIPNAISCPTCSTCCNSDEMCQLNLIWPLDIKYVGFIVCFSVPLGLGLIILLVYKGFKLKDNRDPLSIFDENSSYVLVFTDSKAAYFIFAVTFFVQGLFYYTFLLASTFDDVSSDWQFTLICPNTSAVCKDSNTVSKFGWFLFFVVTIATLGVDYVNSALQIRKSMVLLDPWLFFSGFLHMAMTVLALFASGFYNQALATSNTELIVNAVILLFINDLDEQFMNIFQVLAPGWVDERIEEVRKNMIGRVEDDGRKPDNVGGSMMVGEGATP